MFGFGSRLQSYAIRSRQRRTVLRLMISARRLQCLGVLAGLAALTLVGCAEKTADLSATGHSAVPVNAPADANAAAAGGSGMPQPR